MLIKQDPSAVECITKNEKNYSVLFSQFLVSCPSPSFFSHHLPILPFLVNLFGSVCC